MEIISNIYVFTVTFDQFNTSSLNKITTLYYFENFNR